MFTFNVSKLIEFSTTYMNNFNFIINGVSTVSNPKNNTILFINRLKNTMISKLSNLGQCVLIINIRQNELIGDLRANNLVILSPNPRLEYARLLQFIIKKTSRKRDNICLATSVGNSFRMGEGTIIEQNVVIGDNVQLGKGCVIKTGAAINSNVTVGDNTIVRENAVIGGYGFGFERDENDIPIRLPHIGGVVIGRHVEIGAMTTVCAGTIEPTIIEDYTKIDDHVHIAHNCHVGQKCLITACAEISGSVFIGDNTWLGPNCSIINGITIGKNCFIGIGAVVTKSVPAEVIVTGSPARLLEDIKQEKDIYKELVLAYRKGNLQFKK